MRPPSTRMIAALVAGVLAVNCSLASQVIAPAPTPAASTAALPAPTAAPATPLPAEPAASPAPLDSDSDGLLNPADNCPATPNPNQSDADGNGVGDLCDAPFATAFAYKGAAGVLEMSLDARLRPAQITGPDAVMALAWAADASVVDVTTTTAAGETSYASLAIDLSDARLLAAEERLAASTGQDLTTWRDWLAAHPGEVLAVARGEMPPPLLFPASSGAGGGALAAPARQQDQPDVNAYVGRLYQAGHVAFEALWQFEEAHPELTPAAAIGRNLLRDNATTVIDFANEEYHNCLAVCSERCRVECGRHSKGACYPNFPNPPCFEGVQTDCNLVTDTFFLGQACSGACWATAGGVTDCVWTLETTCNEMPARGGDVTTQFYKGQTCADPRCSAAVVLRRDFDWLRDFAVTAGCGQQEAAEQAQLALAALGSLASAVRGLGQ